MKMKMKKKISGKKIQFTVSIFHTLNYSSSAIKLLIKFESPNANKKCTDSAKGWCNSYEFRETPTDAINYYK